MVDLNLLKIIHEESEQSGFADGKTVEDRYGSGFSEAFRALIQRGYISRQGPVGSISLTPTGHAAAER